MFHPTGSFRPSRMTSTASDVHDRMQKSILLARDLEQLSLHVLILPNSCNCTILRIDCELLAAPFAWLFLQPRMLHKCKLEGVFQAPRTRCRIHKVPQPTSMDLMSGYLEIQHCFRNQRSQRHIQRLKVGSKLNLNLDISINIYVNMYVYNCI